jgi:hypothetical protein
MKLTIPQSRLVEKRSDEQDQVRLLNHVRDGVLNKKGTYFATATTTDASTITPWTDTLSASQSVFLELKVTCVSLTGFDVGSFWRRVSFASNPAGVVDAIGAGADIIGNDLATVAGLAAGFAEDDTLLSTIYVYITGVANETFHWNCEINAIWSPFT